MKYLFFILSSSIAIAQIPFGVGDPGLRADSAAAPPPGITYLINQGFEGTGYDNSEVWTEPNGTPDEDYATDPGAGLQSLRMNGSTTQRAQTPTFADTTNSWGIFMFQIEDPPDSGNPIVIRLRNGTTEMAQIAVNSTGGMRVSNGGNSTPTTATMSTNTWYFIRWNFITGSGADSIINAEFSLTIDGFSGDGTDFTQITNGTATAALNNVRINAENAGFIYKVDNFQIAAEEIP